MLALQYYRQERGWSQKALADASRTYQPVICNIEHGRLKPDDALLARIAAALGVAPAFTLLRPVAIRQQVVFHDADGQVSA